MPKFQITLHIKDSDLLYKFKEFLNGVGSIYIYNKSNRAMFTIDSSKDMKVLIEFLDTYHLKSKKLSDYLLFKKGVEILNNKEHLTKKGLLKVINLKASINLGLSDELKEIFKDHVPRLCRFSKGNLIRFPLENC